MLKRAQESAGAPVNLLIVLIAIAVAFVVILGYILPSFLKISDRENCRLSVIARSQTKILKTESELALNCHTNIIDIKKDGIYRDGNIDVAFKRGETVSDTEYKVKKYIANQMYDCWYQFNEGQSDPWGDWHLGTIRHCVICADINFDPEFNEKISKIIGFGEFINEEPYSRTSKDTYADYLGGRLEMDEDIYIDTSQPHLVLYQLQDLGQFGGVLSVATAVCGPLAIGAAFGPIGWATAGTGCVIGFAGGIYKYMVGRDNPEEVNLRASIIFAPTDAVKTGVCSIIG